MIKTYQEEISNTEPVEIDKESLNEVGRLIISDKIDLKMPIVNGATFENMKDSVATIRHDKIIDNKNYSIAGHRYITKGRHFNRLDELEKGDDIQIITDDGSTIYYKVYDKLVVEPEDISVLEDDGKTEITLITCHPPGISSHRLVVKAEKEDSNE